MKSKNSKGIGMYCSASGEKWEGGEKYAAEVKLFGPSSKASSASDLKSSSLMGFAAMIGTRQFQDVVQKAKYNIRNVHK